MIPFIITVSVSLAITCACSILEAVLLSLSSTEMAKLNEKNPRSMKIWKRLKENIHQPHCRYSYCKYVCPYYRSIAFRFSVQCSFRAKMDLGVFDCIFPRDDSMDRDSP